jgi:hypothetical protein
MTERSEVIIRLGLLGQVASSQPMDAVIRTVGAQPKHGEEAS